MSVQVLISVVVSRMTLLFLGQTDGSLIVDVFGLMDGLVDGFLIVCGGGRDDDV